MLISFLQLILATFILTTMSGKTEDIQLFVEILGVAENGKTVICEYLTYILDKYAHVFKKELVMKNNKSSSSNGPTPDVIALRLVRFAFIDEVSNHDAIDEEELRKYIMGTLSGRDLHSRKIVKFKAHYMLWIDTNQLWELSNNKANNNRREVAILLPSEFVAPDQPANPANNI